MNGVALGETFDLVFPMFPHPLFQVAGHACVERSLGFVGHDVDRRLFHDGCTVMDSRLRGNDGGGLRRQESMVAVLVLHDNTESFPRRRESIEYDSSSDVGWAKRSVPNALEVSIPKVCQATCPNCQAANSESPHPVFQVAGHACVERSLGFVGHDVERGLSHDCAPLWIPAFAGMTGEACAGMA